jgi:hypothetical protein
MAKTERIFDMLELVRNNPGVYNAIELAGLCGVSERGIFRYKKSLANAGIVIRSGYEQKMFSIGLEYRIDLDNGRTARLRLEFEKNGIALSHSASVQVEEKGSKWQVVDDRQIYIIRKRAGNLSVCRRGGYRLLGPYWKKVLKTIGPEECKAATALVAFETLEWRHMQMAVHLKDLPLDMQIEIVKGLPVEDQVELAQQKMGEVLGLIGAKSAGKKAKGWLRSSPEIEETCRTIQMQVLCIALTRGKLEAAKWLRRRVKNPALKVPEGPAKDLYEEYLRRREQC